jgi:hypothetical protein
MIVGRFGNTTGRPYIEGRLIIPRFRAATPIGLGVATGDISFLADTGADRTTIMPLDGQRLSIPYHMLTNPIIAYGVGGTARNFVEPAILAFLEPGLRLCVYNIDVLIMEPVQQLQTTPSLLGRDIMNDWILTCNPSIKLLSADVVRSDYDFPFPAHVSALPAVRGVAPPPLHP